jgi:hypothetical protein
MRIKFVGAVLMLCLASNFGDANAADHHDLPLPPSYTVADPGISKSSPAWEGFVVSDAPGWEAFWSQERDIPMIAVGPPVPLSHMPVNSSDVRAVGDAFLTDHVDLFGIQTGNWTAGNPVLINKIWMIPYRESVNEVPIYGGRIDLRINDRGELVAFYARTHPDLSVSTIPSISQSNAFRTLRSERHFPPDLEMETAALEILPMDGAAYLCWRMEVWGSEADQRWTAWVDANSGELRAALTRIITDQVTGNIQGEALPHYWNDPLTAYPFRWENVQVDGSWTTSDSTGHYDITVPGTAPYNIHAMLSGPYVQVLYNDGPEASYDTLALLSPHDWTWTVANARTDERNLYYHTNLVHDFFKILDPDFTGMDYAVPAVCEYGNAYENAFWNGYGIYFGGGGSQFRNFALFCDVIYHEYTHGVTDQIYPPGYLPYIDQSGAMNEAWSDYFACTITNEPLIGEGGLYSSGPLYMRNLNNTLKYPENWHGEVHDDGRIIGGAFWDLRERVGASVSDHLIHFAKYGLAEEFLTYFIDILLTDDDDGNLTNGSPHSLELYESFGIHGIGPGVDPHLSIANYSFDDDANPPSSGNGNGYLEPGETIELSFAVQNDGILYPPPAEDVTVTVNSLHEDIEVVQGQANLGNISCGQTRWTTSPLILHISDLAQEGYARLEFLISANSGAIAIRDTVEVMLDVPQILLADDDGGVTYETYYQNGLHAINRTYVRRNVSSGVNLADLAAFPVVIWFCGDQRTNTITSQDRSRLTNYLNSGGHLIVTGQNVGEDICQTAFFQQALGAIHTDDSLTYRVLDGVEGDPIGDNLWLLLAGASGAQNQNSVAGTHAGPEAFESFRFRDDPQHRAGAVRHEDPSGYRTIYCSFGMEGLSGLAGSAAMSDFLQASLAWLETGTSVDGDYDAKIPLAWSLQPAYPNPFNPTAMLNFTVPTQSEGNLAVYNILGQRVAIIDQGPWSAGTHRVLWNAVSMPSGVYFVCLQAPGIRKVQKLTLIK